MIAKARLAKLTRPSPTAAYPRTRLFEVLQRLIASAPVVWLTGPPGSGKTTLIADYTARHQIDCLWYQMDRGDADVASFFHFLSEALQQHMGDAHAQLPQFQPECLGDVAAFARSYFREVYRRLSTPLLVFDNFQEIYSDLPLNGVLQQALLELPEDGRVIVLSRTDPPASFASLRARGRLELLGWSELRLTLEECRGVVEVRGASLPDSALGQLYARTQGWAAGVVLMLQDFRSGERALSREATAVPTVIFDYLAEEIFQKLAPAVRESLLRLAYLPQITRSMAEKLGVDEGLRGVLLDLGRGDFLATVLRVEPEQISQLHPLLREFLLTRAEETGSPTEIDGRKRRAAQVLAEHEHIEAAAALLMRIRDWPSLDALIARCADALLRQGRAQLLEQWIRALPEPQVRADPHMLHRLGACRFPYAPREARELFTQAYRCFEAQSPVDVAGLLAALNGVLEAVLHDSADDYAVLDPWIEAATHWTRNLTEWPAPDLEARITCNIFVAVALRRPDHPDLHDWRARTQAISRTQRDPNVRITLDSTLAMMLGWNGQFAPGERLLQTLRELLALPEVSPGSAANVAQAESSFYMLCGDRIRCLEAARRGLEIAERSGVRLWNDTFLANALCGALSDGDLESAASCLAQIESKPSAGRRYDVFLRTYGAGWYAMLRGDTFLAHQQLKTAARAAQEVGLPGFQALASLALVHVLLDAADERNAARELARACELTQSLNNRFFDFMTCLCRARFALGRGEAAAVTEALRTGLAVGRERGLTYHLWWQPQIAAKLMQRALEEHIEVEYVRRLIGQRRLMPDPPPYQLPSWPWRYRIRAFGAFRLQSAGDGSTASGKRSGRPLELLKVLVAAGGQHVKLERLADALWPHVDSDYAHRSLNTTLHRLRKLLGDDAALLVQAGELGLNRQLFWLDIWAFEQVCARGAALTSASAPQPGALIAAARQALELYSGPLLAGDSAARWAVAPREHRRNQLLRLMTATCQALDKAGQSDASIELYRQALESEPHAEALYRRLMLVLKQAGRSAEAIEVYHTCKAALQAHQNTAPSPATTDIYHSLVAN